MFRLFQAVSSRLGHAWCAVFHTEPMWPINGYYICRKCQRSFPVLWDDKHLATHAKPVSAPQAMAARLSPLLK
jgi:hypothetical protein